MSPRVVKEQGYDIVIFTQDHYPPHVHAIKNSELAKFTLDPVELVTATRGFTPKMIVEAIEIIRRNKGHCWKIWHDVYGK